MPSWGGTIRTMTASATTTVEIDSGLLERLRQRRPAKSDRELLESIARIQLGREASDRASEPRTNAQSLREAFVTRIASAVEGANALASSAASSAWLLACR
jgi:hypothetical protein